jgi:hypothetical protein
VKVNGGCIMDKKFKLCLLIFILVSLFTQITNASISADCNEDGIINAKDLAVLALSYGSSQEDIKYNVKADFNEDGKIDRADFTIFKNSYLNINPISPDAQICKDLGIMPSSDISILDSQVTRIQCAVYFLRFKGLEAEARAYTGTDNFLDAYLCESERSVMAYLKNNPQLGFVGDGTYFDPLSNASVQMYYKIMLAILGYQQGIDFTYSDTIAFAAYKGLNKVANVTNFTMNDLAIATVEALNTTVRGSTVNLITILVRSGLIDRQKALAAGFTVTDN